MTQLNTSPWPTTGTSPVQNSSTPAWPSMGNTANSGASATAPSTSSTLYSIIWSKIDGLSLPPRVENDEEKQDMYASYNTTTAEAFPLGWTFPNIQCHNFFRVLCFGKQDDLSGGEECATSSQTGSV